MRVGILLVVGVGLVTEDLVAVLHFEKAHLLLAGLLLGLVLFLEELHFSFKLLQKLLYRRFIFPI